MYDHLAPKTAVVADMPDNERIDYCRKSFFIHTDFTRLVIDDVQTMIRMERGSTNVCRVLVGDTGMGKTSLIKAIVAACNTPECSPMAVVDLANTGRRTDLQDILVSLLGFTQPAHKMANINGTKLIKAKIEELGLRLLVLDEANALVAATFFAEGNRTFLRAMSNPDIGLNLMLVGTPHCLGFLRKNAELPSRFGRIDMVNWDPVSADFSRFLNGYLTLLPLRKKSAIDTLDMQQLIVRLGGQLTRDIKRILTDAAIHAIVNEVECITEEVILKSYNEALAFYAPNGVI